MSVKPSNFTLERLPPELRELLRDLYTPKELGVSSLLPNQIYHGDSLELLPQIQPNSVALSVWSPPYFVGKEYEADLSYQDWEQLLKETIRLHFPIIKPGGFLVINIADILCFRDDTMPRIQAEVVHRKKSAVTKAQILKTWAEQPHLNRHQLARLLGCSEQTIDRRLNGNNIRGGKHEAQTRVKVVGGLLEEWGMKAGFYLYDRRIWAKDPAWENSRWTSLSYRAVDEFEYLYFFWKPGITTFDRHRLSGEEWRTWGSRAVWSFPSVRANDDHEAKFPLELPRRVIRLLSDPGDIVLDCFLGSGTTAVAAIQAKRQFIGIELEPTYISLAQQNIDTALGNQHATKPA